MLNSCCFSDVKNNEVDPKTTVECGTLIQVFPEGALPMTITCEKCMPYGNYVIIQNGVKRDNKGKVVQTFDLGLAEIAIYGLPMIL